MVLVSLLNDVVLHLHILHDEISTLERVGHDTTNEGSGEHHGVGLLLVKEVLYCELVSKVQFFVCAANKIIVATLLQVVPNSRSYQSMMTGNVNLRIFF